MTPQERGREFEQEVEESLGLRAVPGSGNQWYSKLDIRGRETRWSLKYTDKDSYRIDKGDIDEAVGATFGVDGDGRIPIWLIRLGEPRYDLVVMRKDDFLAAKENNFDIIGDIHAPRPSDIRRARARIPVLMREEDADQ